MGPVDPNPDLHIELTKALANESSPRPCAFIVLDFSLNFQKDFFSGGAWISPHACVEGLVLRE